MIKSQKIKWLLLVVSFVVRYNGTAQSTSGEVIYKVVKTHELTDFMDNEGVQSIAKKVQEISKDFTYKLSYNENESIFRMLPLMAVGDHSALYVNAAKFALNGNNVYYLNKNKELLITQKTILGEQYLITESYTDFEWKITNETKKIDGFTCYKAIGFRIARTREFKQEKVQKTAWFCPELPNIYGPFESVGLPGLVLEFQIGEYSFIARKIKRSKVPLIIKAPSAGKKTTRQELNNRFFKLANKQNN